TNPDIKNPIVTNLNSGVGGGGTTDGSDGSGEDDGSSEPGDTEALSVTQRGATSISISWVARAGSAADPTQWQYKVVKAGVVDDLDTVEKADAATTAMDWTANVSSSEITGLTEGTSYAFNVLAKDAEGNVTI